MTCAAAHDYESFFAAESAARAELMYPPHGRLIAVRIDGADAARGRGDVAERLAQVAEAVAQRARERDASRSAAPVPAPLERLRNRTRWQIWLRGSDRAALRRVARALLRRRGRRAGSASALDVDPISAL